MARLYDSQGILLGGMNSIAPTVRLTSHPSLARPALAQCSYGSAAFAYQVTPLDVQMARHQPRIRICRNSVAAKSQRFHCKACGGNYCAAHAAPEAHDCALLIPRP